MTEDLVVKNTAQSIKLPSVPKWKGKVWSSEEARQFLESARSERDLLYADYVLILVLGLRKGEYLAWRGTTSTSTPGNCRSVVSYSA